jgi:hypothetical protein
MAFLVKVVCFLYHLVRPFTNNRGFSNELAYKTSRFFLLILNTAQIYSGTNLRITTTDITLKHWKRETGFIGKGYGRWKPNTKMVNSRLFPATPGLSRYQKSLYMM